MTAKKLLYSVSTVIRLWERLDLLFLYNRICLMFLSIKVASPWVRERNTTGECYSRNCINAIACANLWMPGLIWRHVHKYTHLCCYMSEHLSLDSLYIMKIIFLHMLFTLNCLLQKGLCVKDVMWNAILLNLFDQLLVIEAAGMSLHKVNSDVLAQLWWTDWLSNHVLQHLKVSQCLPFLSTL